MLRQSFRTLMARRLFVVPVAVITLLTAGVGGRAAIHSNATDATAPGQAVVTQSPSPGAAGSNSAGQATGTEELRVEHGSPGGGVHNVVDVRNHKDNTLRADGRVQVTAVHSGDVEPVNSATAYSSCQHCDTIAVALQIALVSRNAPVVAPHNSAVAVNYRCTGCVTIAVAYQYLIPVDDPESPGPEVRRLVADMNHELAHLRNGHTPLAQAINEVNNVISQYSDLVANLTRQQKQTNDDDTPGATPAPDTTPSPSSAVTPAPSGTTTTSGSSSSTPTVTSTTTTPTGTTTTTSTTSSSSSSST